jgi:hypothetical protein
MKLLAHWEHWRCLECGIFDGPHSESYCDVCHEQGIDDAVVEEYVRAEDHRGAVEALREFQDAYVREFGMGRGSDFVVRHVEVITAALEVVAR